MIVKIPFEDIKDYGVKVKTDSKSIQSYMRVVVTENNISDAISALQNNRYVLAFDLDSEADLSKLECMDLKGATVLYHAKYLAYSAARQLMQQAPKSVRVVFKVAEDFSDMLSVWKLCKEFPNVSFCGGHLFRLPGCRIGCIQASDLKGKAPAPTSAITNGCGCAMKWVNSEDVTLEFTGYTGAQKTELTKRASSGTKSAATKKKSVLSSMFVTSGVDEF